MNTLTVPHWRAKAACSTADADLFFPDPDTPQERIDQAKQICASCPVKQACLEDAIRRGESEAICGGLTGRERRSVVALDTGRRLRRPGRASARQLAVKHGAHLLVALVEWKMSVQQVAESLGSTPMGVYRAYLLLVPPRPGLVRNKKPSRIEELLRTSKETLRSLERRGLSHSEIGVVLGAVLNSENTPLPQSMVSAALSVLRQREEGIRRLSKNGVDGLERLQAEEMRVLRECGAGLSVSDVIALEGDAIVRLHRNGSGLTLRDIAAQLGLCRETVRKAYLEMTSDQQVVRDLTQDEMGEAA
ncbi:WhiB family transcriptional regulator [Streptomyces africanus]|uniref:WhiB family transcriptional regulator n=1 Tax=Streptomyces africanus TaxID=231024 RepID=UPI000A3C444C|nr:WhiB family transcriptional regulator [Streptomyces africanus]